MLRSKMIRELALCSLVFGGLLVQAGSAQLAVTEVMWKSAHPEADPVSLVGGNANGDWFELFSAGDTPINRDGYLFDDDYQLFVMILKDAS